MGVTVELVAVVVDESGRDGMRDAGLVPFASFDLGGSSGFFPCSPFSWCICSRDFEVEALGESSVSCSRLDLERDRERVRKL